MITLLTLFCLSYIVTTTDFPLVLWIKNHLGIGDNRTLISENKFIDNIYKAIHKVFNCPICCAFWLILICTFSFSYAIIAYVAMTITVNVIDFLHTNIKY